MNMGFIGTFRDFYFSSTVTFNARAAGSIPAPVTFSFLRLLPLAERTLSTKNGERMDLSINEGTLVVTGGPGDTLQTAIVIRKTPRGLSAAGAEHMLLGKWFGQRNTDWTMKRQAMVQVDGRTYDTFEVVLNNGSERRLHFDVTDWLASVGAPSGCRSSP